MLEILSVETIVSSAWNLSVRLFPAVLEILSAERILAVRGICQIISSSEILSAERILAVRGICKLACLAKPVRLLHLPIKNIADFLPGIYFAKYKINTPGL